MGRFATDKVVRTARKPHQCMYCLKTIQPGEKYWTWTWHDDDDGFSRCDCHPGCYRFMKSYCDSDCPGTCDGYVETCYEEAAIDRYCTFCERRHDHSCRGVYHCEKVKDAIKEDVSDLTESN